MKIYNPDDSPNTDGIDPESCENIEIVGTKISVGDDCIAIKSGKIYLGKKLKKPTTNMSVRNCYMERGHGASLVVPVVRHAERHTMAKKYGVVGRGLFRANS